MTTVEVIEFNERRPPISLGLALGLLLAAVTIAGNLVFRQYHVQMFRAVPFSWSIINAWECGGVALLAIWLALGRTPMFVRLFAVAILAAVEAALMAAFCLHPRSLGLTFSWQVVATMLVDRTLLIVAMALPLALLRLAGFAVSLQRGGRVSTDRCRRPGQFTVRQIFAWTFAAALLAGMSRFGSLPFGSSAVPAICTAIYSLIATGMACAVLTPRGNCLVAAWTIGVAAVSPILGGCVAVLTLPRDVVSGLAPGYAVMSLCYSLLVCGALLLYRCLGYRLCRAAG